MFYKYIHPASKFTAEQKDFYEKNGYILIRNNVDHHLIDKFYKRFVEIAEKGNPDSEVKFIVKDPCLKRKGAKGEYAVNKIEDFIDDEILSEYCRCNSVVDVVENIIGPNITAVQTMIVNKPPDSHVDFSKHPMHQDMLYFPFRPADKIVASWTAMESTHVENGCLFVVPGTHTTPIYEHRYPDDKKHTLYLEVVAKTNLPKVDLIMEKGDTVFFHPCLFHGSYPNQTKHFRKAISCHYADSNCFFFDIRNTYLEPFAKEAESLLVEKKLPMSYQELFKSKSRLIRGQPGEFQRFDNHL